MSERAGVEARGRMERQFEDKFVAFIDILGFSDLVREHEQAGSSADQIIELVGKLATSKDAEMFRDGPLACPQSEYKSRDLSFRLTQVSDCVVASAETSPAGVINLLNYCRAISFRFMSMGHLCRGYVTRGRIFHQDGQFFGSGYVNAYAGESRVSVFRTHEAEQGTPFIELDESVVDYVRDESDDCVRLIFGRLTETDGRHHGIFPFRNLLNIPDFAVNTEEDRVRFNKGVLRMIETIEGMLDKLEQNAKNASPAAKAKIEHYKRKLRWVLIRQSGRMIGGPIGKVR